MPQRLSTEERQQEVLDAALEIIFKDGFYNLTMRNIARDIGISEAAIYRHFSSKEEIVESLADIVFYQNQLWNKSMEEVDVFYLLEEIMLRQLRVLKDRPYLTAILFQEGIFSEYPDIREKFNIHRENNIEIIKGIIIKGIKAKLISNDVNPDVFAVLYMGALRMTVLNWRASDFSYDPEDKARLILEELFKYIKRRR
ncbi:MAG: TetR/AcrR family transcriptional regulator [Bacillota bacterium]